MDPLPKEELKDLLEKQGLCVSIYMPTHRAGPEIRKDPILLKNLLREAEERLIARDLRATEAREMLAPAQKLQDDAFFWRHQADGLALFLSKGFFRHYRLSVSFQESVAVTGRFQIKPLVPLLGAGSRFFVLALSQNEVRFLKCTQQAASEMELPNVPKSMAEALKYDNPEQQIQLHTGTPRAGGGKRPAIFHGQGGGDDDYKLRIQRYFQLVHKGLKDLFREEQSPLVLAGVDFLLPLYREVNTYPYLLEAGISGNPEIYSPEELHRAAAGIVENYLQKAQRQAIDQFRELKGSNRSSNDIRVIVPAARHGRVDKLFVAAGSEQWGSYDHDTGSVDLHIEAEQGDEDLLDFAAAQTFLNGGTVYSVEAESVPDGSPLAAVFRY